MLRMEESFTVSTDQSKLDITFIEKFLAEDSYWAKGRNRETIQHSIENSLCFGVYSPEEKQVGFARVVSDFTIFAWIMDVFIIDEYRAKGLGKLLMANIMDHPRLQNLNRWGLNTKDAHGLYGQFGFKGISKPEQMMEKIKENL